MRVYNGGIRIHKAYYCMREQGGGRVMVKFDVASQAWELSFIPDLIAALTPSFSHTTLVYHLAIFPLVATHHVFNNFLVLRVTLLVSGPSFTPTRVSELQFSVSSSPSEDSPAVHGYQISGTTLPRAPLFLGAGILPSSVSHKGDIQFTTRLRAQYHSTGVSSTSFYHGIFLLHTPAVTIASR